MKGAREGRKGTRVRGMGGSLLVLFGLVAGCDSPTDGSGDGLLAPQTFVAVATGADHTCAVRIDGTLWCWGDGTFGQLGTGESRSATLPARAFGNETYVGVAAGQRHACGVTDQGAIYCWGWNNHRQLGDGTGFTHNIPTRVASDVRFTQVVAGIHHTCALSVDGVAWCWGASGQGRLGVGSAGAGSGTGADVSIPTAVLGGHRFTSLAAGGFHTCGVRADGRALCWGMNHAGQLGDATTQDRATPALVAGNLTFVSVNGGYSHTCGLTSAGTVHCWGELARGALGDRTAGPAGSGSPTPSQVFSDPLFDQVSAGLHYTCAVDRGGRVHCWGAGTEGQLGDARLQDWATPQLVTVPSQAPFRVVTASWGGHTCALTRGAALYCWGDGARGALGVGAPRFSASPVRVQIP